MTNSEWFSTQEEANQERRRLAREFVDSLPLDIQDDLGALAQLSRAVHLGTDLWGERIASGGIKKLKQSEQALRTRLAQKYGAPDPSLGLDQTLLKFHFNLAEVKTELATRADLKVKSKE